MAETAPNVNTIDKLRSYRIGPFAIFDFAASYAGIWMLAPYLKNYATREQLLWLTVPIGIATHVVIGRTTPLNKMVLGSDYNIFAQAIIAYMLYRGIFTYGEQVLP